MCVRSCSLYVSSPQRYTQTSQRAHWKYFTSFACCFNFYLFFLLFIFFFLLVSFASATTDCGAYGLCCASRIDLRFQRVRIFARWLMVSGDIEMANGGMRDVHCADCAVHVVTSARSAPRLLLLLLLPLSILLQFASHEYSSSYFHFLFHSVEGLGSTFFYYISNTRIFFLSLSISLSLSVYLSVSAKHLCRWQTARSVVCFSFIRWQSLTTGMAKDDQIKLCVSVRFECSELLRGY